MFTSAMPGIVTPLLQRTNIFMSYDDCERSVNKVGEKEREKRVDSTSKGGIKRTIIALCFYDQYFILHYILLLSENCYDTMI